MQPDNYKPKTTIIPANPGFWHHGHPVVAWVIEDGEVARPVTLAGNRTTIEYAYDPQPVERGGDV